MQQQSRPGPMRRLWNGFWGFIDGTRRVVLNLIFLLVLIFIVSALFGLGGRQMEPGTALLLQPKGEIVEQYSADPGDRVLAQLTGDQIAEVQLRDVLRALESAATDPNIDRVVIRTEQFLGAGLATLREVGRAIDAVKASGKEVLAYGDWFDQRGYYLAARADRIYLNPNGGVLLEGLGRNRLYYRSLLEKLKVDVHVFRVGEYKSAVEPYLLDGPSEAALEADSEWLSDLWQVYIADVSQAREFDPGFVDRWIEQLPELVEEVDGDFAQLALGSHLVDELLTEDQFRKLLAERGSVDPDTKEARTIDLLTYAEQHAKPSATLDAPQLAVIVAQGEIIDGEHPQGTVGGLSTSALVRQAREDSAIKAVVLRVDSPGGSAFASEQIRRELELTREAGKPVVISMGDVAASGGYWISMTSDAIYADPATITGSIGIFGLFPSVDRTMDAVGLHADGAGTTWLAGALDPRKPLDPRVGRLIQSGIEQGYREFIGKVAESREQSTEAIDRVARGRVWSGQDASERGLVDELGGLQEAMNKAATLANLGDNYQVRYVEREMSGFQRFLLDVFSTHVGTQLLSGLDLQLPPGVSDSVRQSRSLLRLFGDAREHPLRTYAYCFCEVRD
ncbi:MAG: signal peptide peptidase SppA [Xanthomonadales bacterium]|nr:signal peptide peptidase SppA [Xanthomonadales bacterium]MCB1640488.1 signal peptide peptidase SppA [Xanthomonadales bacterium]